MIVLFARGSLGYKLNKLQFINMAFSSSIAFIEKRSKSSSTGESLRRRANAQNVSFRISSRWPIHIINPVDKTKLSRHVLQFVCVRKCTDQPEEVSRNAPRALWLLVTVT